MLPASVMHFLLTMIFFVDTDCRRYLYATDVNRESSFAATAGCVPVLVTARSGRIIGIGTNRPFAPPS